MSVRLTHGLSLINWQQPFSDPLLCQFIPMGFRLLADHPELRLNSFNEIIDCSVKNLFHRYSDKAVFSCSFECLVHLLVVLRE